MKYPISKYIAPIRLASQIVVIIVMAVNYSKIVAQELGGIKLSIDENSFSLQVDNIKKDQSIFFGVGQTLGYKTLSFKGFREDRITGITDSTISFESISGEHITILRKDIVKLAIPKSFVGPILIVTGVPIAAISAASTKNSVTPPYLDIYNESGIILGSAMITAGLTLAIAPRHVKIGKAWVLKATKAIVPSNIITITLKDGGVVKMKVEKVEQEKITGAQRSIIANGQKVEARSTILIKDIIACSRNAN